METEIIAFSRPVSISVLREQKETKGGSNEGPYGLEWESPEDCPRKARAIEPGEDPRKRGETSKMEGSMKRRTFRFSAILLGMFLVSVPAGCGGTASLPADMGADIAVEPFFSPDEPGPYPVGIRRSVHVNPERYHLYGSSFRTHPTTIWYPALESSGRPNTLKDCMGELPEWAVLRLEEMTGGSFSDIEGLETAAFRDARFDRSGAPYPVLFFSHGVSSNRFQSWDQCEHLASHGFIVVAPDHYGTALVTNTEEVVVFFNPLMVPTDLIDRPADVGFFYRELERMDADPDHFLHQGLDLSRFGILGHSWGGFTCMAAAPEYTFVKALAALAPIMTTPFPEPFHKPFFLLQNDTDDICDASLESNARARSAFMNCRADPGIYVRLLNAGHFSPSNVCHLAAPMFGPAFSGKADPARTGCEPGFMDVDRANRIAAAYLTAFFKSALAGDFRYREFMAENRFPGEAELYLLHSLF